MGALVIEFPCLYCGQSVRTEEGLAGTHIECPACGHSVAVHQRKLGDALRPIRDADEEEQKKASSWEQKSDREIAERLLPKAMTNQEQQEQAVKKAFSFLTPRYDDLTLFALSLSFLLLWLINADLRRDLTKVFLEGWSGDITIWLIVAVIGMALSLINVFLQREKSDFEKSTMLIFAVVVTAGTGLYAGWIMLHESKGWLLIFPAWNILNGGLLLLLFRLGVVDTDCIVDEQASFAEVVLTAICVPVLLTVCHYWFELHWAVTFSIAVAYTMSLHNGIRDVFGARRPAPNMIQDP
jgi:DNA-directed RNA polymerase subunit RPC12/RpoP